LEAVPEKHSMYSLQTTAILGTSHIIRKVLQSATGSLSGKVPGKKRLATRDNNNTNTNNNNNLIITIIKYVSNVPANYEVKGTTENSHIEHCTHTSESANVKVQ
jgi:hypothetical protein